MPQKTNLKFRPDLFEDFFVVLFCCVRFMNCLVIRGLFPNKPEPTWGLEWIKQRADFEELPSEIKKNPTVFIALVSVRGGRKQLSILTFEKRPMGVNSHDSTSLRMSLQPRLYCWRESVILSGPTTFLALIFIWPRQETVKASCEQARWHLYSFHSWQMTGHTWPAIHCPSNSPKLTEQLMTCH